MNTLRDTERKGLDEVIEQAIDYLEQNPTCEGADLHHEVYNMDYFIIGRYQAEEWLKEHYGIFNALDTIKEYEQDNFGEVTTDIGESERVCNMLVYIIGEEVLAESEHLRECWDRELTKEDCKIIIGELKEI